MKNTPYSYNVKIKLKSTIQLQFNKDLPFNDHKLLDKFQKGVVFYFLFKLFGIYHTGGVGGAFARFLGSA